MGNLYEKERGSSVLDRPQIASQERNWREPRPYDTLLQPTAQAHPFTSEELLALSIVREKMHVQPNGEHNILQNPKRIGEERSYLRKKNREVVGSEAFNLNYDAPPKDEEIRADVISYLKEYRLKAQRHDYVLIYGCDQNGEGEMTIRDEKRGEPMKIKAKRVIEERKIKGKSTDREEAEEAGLGELDSQAPTAEDGDTAFWLTPPGLQVEGYGEYGFVFRGKITDLGNGERLFAMSAFRVEHAGISREEVIEKYNAAFSALTSEQIIHSHATDFLKTPKFVRGSVEEEKITDILRKNFSFTTDSEGEHKNRAIIQKIEQDGLFSEFIRVMRIGSNEEKKKTFYALENYALKLKDKPLSELLEKQDKTAIYTREPLPYPTQEMPQTRFKNFVAEYGFRPPVAPGSCGSTGEQESNSLISAGRSGGIGGKSAEWFTCPQCQYQASGPVGDACPGCGLTKEEYAKTSGKQICE